MYQYKFKIKWNLINFVRQCKSDRALSFLSWLEPSEDLALALASSLTNLFRHPLFLPSHNNTQPVGDIVLPTEHCFPTSDFGWMGGPMNKNFGQYQRLDARRLG